MLLVNEAPLSFFQFPALNRFGDLFHAVSCRQGGRSAPPFDSLNVSHGIGDDPFAVDANRSRLLALAGGRHVYSRQNHGTAIRVIGAATGEEGKGAIETTPVPADALITDRPGVRLLIQTADCQAVLLFDPQRRIVANVHCGWRGSVADILGRTVRQMVRRFGCDPGSMVAAIGPSLGPCCAEFIHYEKELPTHLWPFRVGRCHFDFWRISRHQLVSAGLGVANVHVSGICTRCNPHLFFSYRAMRQTGRFVALIGMNGDAAAPR